MADKEVETDVGEVSLVGRLVGLVLRPNRTSLILGGFLCLAIAGTLASTMFGTQAEPVDTLPKAWELLEKTRYPEARAMATRLLSARSGDRNVGEGAYLIGRSLCGEAETEWNDRRRIGLYLVASRYLQEAYLEGFPEGHEDEGTYYLALSTFEAERLTASLPFWRELLERDPVPRRLEVLRRIADVHLRDTKLPPAEGLAVLAELAREEQLGREERDTVQLDTAELQLRAGSLDEALATLAAIPDDTSLRSRLRLLRARTMLVEAQSYERMRSLGQTPPKPIEPIYERAVSELLGIEASLTPDPQERDEANYRLAQCYAKLGDLDRAEQLFAELRRARMDDWLGWSAGVREAMMQFQQADLAEAALRFGASLAAMKRSATVDERWISEAELLGAIETLMQQQIAGKQYSEALELARAMWPPLPRTASLAWQARIRRAWGESLLAAAREPFRSPDFDDQAAREEGLGHLRESGWALVKLATLERSEATYVDHLLAAAAAFADGHDFDESLRFYEEVLDEGSRKNSAWLLLRIGESHLGAGRIDRALEAFERCIVSYPNDPESYLARIEASRILLERDDADGAEKMLLENLENAALTPQSREWRLSLFALARTLFREASLLEAESRSLGVDDPLSATADTAFRKLEESYEAFQSAIRRLNEAVRRYPDDPQIHEYRYLLAEAHRAAAKWPKKKAATVSVAASRLRLEEQARDHARQAIVTIGELLVDLERVQDQRPLDDVERNLLRNCYFAQADLFFDLERYPEAIDAYSSAANRYNDRPESLEAFVRMSICFRRTGRLDDARGVLEQAKLFLAERIPADADYSGTTRHSREDWAGFLDLLTRL